MPRKKKIASVAEAILADDAKQQKKKGKRYTPKFAESETGEAPTSLNAAQTAASGATKRVPPQRKTRAELQKLSTDGSLVDIWERRMLNPNHHESAPIRINIPGMRLRWINLSNRGRFQRARYEQGWVPVHKSELVDEREIFGVSFTAEGHVCRGEKQGEMLMRMPEAVYRKIQQRRAEMNRESYKKLKQNMGSAGYKHFKETYGGSAGDIAEEAASNFVGDVKFGSERVSTDELLGE